jgi:hypothetical protein
MMNSGNQQPIRPSLGSWLTYGLGTENQNLPGFVVLCPGKPVVGPALWSNSFLPGIFQGTHVNNGNIDPAKVIGHLKNTGVTSSSQRRLLDLMQQMNQNQSMVMAADRGAAGFQTKFEGRACIGELWRRLVEPSTLVKKFRIV